MYKSKYVGGKQRGILVRVFRGEYNYGLHVDLYNELLGWGRVIGVGFTLGRLQINIDFQRKN